MQPQAEPGHHRVGLDDPVGEGRVADREVESAAERTARVVLAADSCLGMDQPGNAGGDRVVFDAGEARALPQRVKSLPTPTPISRPIATPCSGDGTELSSFRRLSFLMEGAVG